MGFRNRCQLAGAEGVVELSVPLIKGRAQKTLVRDVRISNRQPWASQHWKTIVSCYSRSPWFDHYRDDLAGLYQCRFDFLVDWDLACFDWSVRVLGLKVGVKLTEGWRPEYPPNEALDWRGKLKPAGRELGFGVGGNEPIRYRQVFEERTGFLQNLSILDLLFCEGRQAMGYLRG